MIGHGPLGSFPLGGQADSTEGNITPLTFDSSSTPALTLIRTAGKPLTITDQSVPTSKRDMSKPLLGWGANNDPYWSNVVALHRFEGADGSTSFIDTGPTARTYTTNGNAQLDDAQTVHGLTSGLFDGVGDFLTTPDQLDFRASQAGDFTVEAIIRLSVTGGKIHTICCKRASAGNAGEFTFNVDSNNKLNLSIFNINPWTATGATTLLPDVWYRVACERYGTALTVYLNGVVDGTGTQSGTPLSAAGTTFNIGRSVVNTARDFQGWINEFRMTRAARYQGSNYDCRPPAGGKYYSIAKQTGHIVDRLVTPTFTNLVKKTTAWAIDRVVNPTFTAFRRTFLPRTVVQDSNPPSFLWLPNKKLTAPTTPVFDKRLDMVKNIRARGGPRKGDGSMPTFVGVGTVDIGSSQQTATSTYPAGIQKDDLAIFALMWTDALDDPTPPYANIAAGWTKIMTHHSTTGWAVLWYKRLIGNESGSVGATATSQTSLGVMAGSLSVWRGCDTEFDPIEGLDWKHVGLANPNTGHPVFTLGPNRRVVTFFQNLTDASTGVPADGSTSHVDIGSGSGNDGCHAIYSLPAPDVGTVYGPIQRTVAGGSGGYIAVTLALKPTPTGGAGVGGGIDETQAMASVNKAFPYRITPGLKTTREPIALTNAGFETGDATGWTQIYGSNVQVQPTGSDGVNAHGGSYYGAGSASAAAAWWGQTVSLSSDYHTYIDAGIVTAKFSAWHTGYTDTDNGALMVECFDGTGDWLSDIRADFSDPAAWEREYMFVRIPAGTRSIRVSTQNIRITGTQLSSYWDDFELSFEPPFNPTTTRHDLIVSEYGDSTAGWTTTVGTLNTVTSGVTWTYPILYGLSSALLATYKDHTLPSDTHANIDAGVATMEMVCHLGRGSSQSDAIRVWVECLDASNTILGTIETSAAEAFNPTYWTCFKGTMAVPALTRKFRVRYTGTLTSGGNIDGYLSRLSVFLRSAEVPLPMLSNHAAPAIIKETGKTFSLVSDVQAILSRAVDKVMAFAADVQAAINAIHQTDGEQYEQVIDALSDATTSIVRSTDHYVQRTSDAVTALTKTITNLVARTVTPAYSAVRSTGKPIQIESKGNAYTYGAHRYWRIRAPQTNNADGYLGFTKVKLRATPGGTDLANGRTANASAIHGSYPPSNATDSNSSSFWTTVTAAAPAGGHWFSVDLGSGNDAEIVEVALTSRPDGFNEWPLYFIVEYSDNNSTWTPAWTPETWSTSWGNGVEKVFGRTTVAPAGYRYWRVRAPDTYVAGEYWGVAEMEMRENGYDRAGVATITASAVNGSYPVRNMVDSNTSTFWTTGAVGPPGGGHWVRFDFLMPRNISEIRHRVRGDAFREDPAQLVIEYSNNGSSWTSKWSESSIATWTAGQQRTFTDPDPVNYNVPMATLVRQTGHYINSVVDVSAAVLRMLGKAFAANANTTATIIKSTGKVISPAIDVVADMAKEFLSGVIQYNREFTAMADAVMSVHKGMAHNVDRAVDGNASIMRTLGRTFAQVANAPAILMLQMGKAFTALGNAAMTSSRSTSKPVNRTADTATTTSRASAKTINRAISATAQLARNFGKTILRSAAVAMSIVRTLSKSTTASANTLMSMARTLGRTFTKPVSGEGQTTKLSPRTFSADANTEAEGIASKAFLKFIETVTTPVANAARSTGRIIGAASDVVTSMARGMFKTLSNAASSVAQTLKLSPRTFSAETAPEPDVQSGKSYSRFLSVIANTSSSTVRATSKLLDRTVDATTSVARTIARPFVAAATTVAETYRGISRTLNSVTTSIVTVEAKKTAEELTINATAQTETQIVRQRVSIISAGVMVASSLTRNITKTFSKVINVFPFIRRESDAASGPATVRGGQTGGMGSFTPAHEVRRRNKERQVEDEKKVVITLEVAGNTVQQSYPIDDTDVRISINIRKLFEKAVVAVKSIFIKETKDPNPVVRIKRDD